MHVLVIPSWYALPSEPRRGSFFRDQAEALAAAGHQVGILVPPGRPRTRHGAREFGRHPVGPKPRWDTGGQLPTITVPSWGWRTVAPSLRPTVVLAAFDRYVAAQGTPDVVHAHGSLHGGTAARWICDQRHVPYVVTEHSSAFLQASPIFRSEMRLAARNFAAARRVLAVGRRLAQALTARFGIDVEVIPNVVADVFGFRPPPARPPLRFLAIGRLHPVKRFDLLIRAFAAAGIPDARLDVVGEGPRRRALERLVAELDLGASVSLPGGVDRGGVAEQIALSHVVVSASSVETFGLTVAEALVTGRPVITTRSGGPEDLMSAGDGIVVDDPADLATAMQAMAERYDSYDQPSIARRAAARWSTRSVVASLEEIYREVVAGP